MNAISVSDIETFRNVRNLRNRIAHELLDLMGSEGLPAEFDARYTDLLLLMSKIEVWWIREFDIPANDEFDGQHPDEMSISPGPVIALQVLSAVVLGSEEESRRLLASFQCCGEENLIPGSNAALLRASGCRPGPTALPRAWRC